MAVGLRPPSKLLKTRKYQDKETDVVIPVVRSQVVDIDPVRVEIANDQPVAALGLLPAFIFFTMVQLLLSPLYFIRQNNYTKSK
ncbi:MAG: hypothetical protein HYS83_00930 [Candidatus Blackburnbacteria bacterium]|nr:hypothetical protein [Candidatus Blackburnbacteria bacterium]